MTNATTTNPTPRGVILYEGPSRFDGEPIVVIATGIKRPTTNTKTGRMVQTWILHRDIAPHEAVRTGEDESICGKCPLRGDKGKGRGCYVRVEQAPLGVWKAYKRGSYVRLTDAEVRHVLAGRQVRLGAYGDPAMAPIKIWHNALRKASNWTGYTHQWRTAPRSFAKYVMASAETMADAVTARAAGYRTFRVGWERAVGEKPCPAGPAESKVQCVACPLKCNGGDGASIVIQPHGKGATSAAFAS